MLQKRLSLPPILYYCLHNHLFGMQPVQTLEEAVEQAVAQRVEAERKVLEAEYYQRETALLETITRLEANIAAVPQTKKK